MPADLRLPIRLLPRKKALIYRVCFFAFFFVFSVFWTLGAMVKSPHVDIFGFDLTNSEWRGLFPLFGIPFILIGASGLLSTVIKMLPGNPYFHLDIFADGLVVRNLTTEQSLAWRDLAALTVKEESNSEAGTQYTVVSMHEASGKPREMLSLPVDQYGTKNDKKSANELAAWINRLRELALQNRLKVGTQVEIPDELAHYVIALSTAARPSATAARAARAVTKAR